MIIHLYNGTERVHVPKGAILGKTSEDGTPSYIVQVDGVHLVVQIAIGMVRCADGGGYMLRRKRVLGTPEYAGFMPGLELESPAVSEAFGVGYTGVDDGFPITIWEPEASKWLYLNDPYLWPHQGIAIALDDDGRAVAQPSDDAGSWARLQELLG